MQIISPQLALIINLRNIAIHHKENCHTENCNVSLYQLKQAAEYIAKVIRTDYEELEAEKIIKEMPIT